MKNWLYKTASTIFSITLLIYILIWCTVSYMGVKVTYVAGPILLFTGVIVMLTEPNDE